MAIFAPVFKGLFSTLKQQTTFFFIKFFNMFAIVTIAGQQFKVTEGQELFVHRLEAEEGAKVSFDQVHLIDNSGSINVGTPIVKGAKIGATVLDPLVKGDKVIVFKKKRRKGYRVKKGHRQQFSKIKINSITA